jgi:hypothetical protein
MEIRKGTKKIEWNLRSETPTTQGLFTGKMNKRTGRKPQYSLDRSREI